MVVLIQISLQCSIAEVRDYLVVCWSHVYLAWGNWKCTFLPNSMFHNNLLVAWNRSDKKYLLHGNLKTLQIKALVFFLESWLLSTYQHTTGFCAMKAWTDFVAYIGKFQLKKCRFTPFAWKGRIWMLLLAIYLANRLTHQKKDVKMSYTHPKLNKGISHEESQNTWSIQNPLLKNDNLWRKGNKRA